MAGTTEKPVGDGSSPRRLNRSSKLLLTGIILLLAVIEMTVRFGIGRVSAIEGRAERENRAAMAIQPGTESAKSVLVLGNSLLLTGVDFPVLQRALPPRVVASRYVIESTAYLDWYYYMRNLYSRGGRPDVVILNLSTSNMISDEVRGDYFGYRMMNTRDILNVSRDAKLNATETFSLLVGNLSAFYGTRSETHKFMLKTLVPGINNLVSSIVPAGAAPPRVREATASVVSRRFAALKHLVSENGGRLIFVSAGSMSIPGVTNLCEAGRMAEVPVLVPLPPESMSKSDFTDGYHLAPAGAKRYTSALAPMLRHALDEIPK